MNSKFMSVDHRCCIVGSANINDRSLNGQRDSEVALLCTAPDGCNELRDFCLDSLADHAGGDRAFWAAQASSVALLEELNARAAANDAVYRDDNEVRELPHRHIVPYPIEAYAEAPASELVMVHGACAVKWLGIPDCVDPVLDSPLVPQWIVE